MIQRTSSVTDEYTRPVPGAHIYVYNQDGTDAVLTSDGTAPLEQPLISNEFGAYSYYADDGVYREDVWYAGKKRAVDFNIILGDPPQYVGPQGPPGAPGGVQIDDTIADTAPGASAVTRSASKIASIIQVGATSINANLRGVSAGNSDNKAALQTVLDEAAVLGATIYCGSGVYDVATTPTLTHAKGVNLVGDGPDHTVIQATGANAAFATKGAWRCKFEGIMFKQGSARTSAGATFELDGETDGSFGVQGMHFDRVYFNANGLADRALAICRVAGGSGQGSENLFTDCNADGALLACVDVMGNNALQNTWIGGNIQGHRMDGIRKTAGGINIYSTGFQSVFALQLDNGGADIQNSNSSVGDRMIIDGCRSESLVFFKGGADLTIIRGCFTSLGVAAVNSRGNSAAVALGTYQRGITATGAQRIYKCTTAGTTGASLPTWPDSGTVTDGTAVWTHFEYSVVDKADLVENCQFLFGNISGNRPLALYRACMFGRPDILKSTDSSYSSGIGPIFDNCAWAANGSTGNPKALGPFGNNAATGARYAHPDNALRQPIDLRDGALVSRNGTGGGSFFDAVWKRWAGSFNFKRSNYWGTPNGIKIGEIAFADIGSVPDVGVLWFVTDGTPGSSPLTGSGTGCLAVYQNGAWKAIS